MQTSLSLPPASPTDEIDLHADAWIRLVEYGDWAHPRGMQRISREAAQQMTRHFRSLRARLARRFGGLPMYVGHPDDPAFSGRPGHSDTRAYAWIQDMEARPDGLYIQPKWSEDGRRLLENAFYKFLSPRWVMKPLQDEPGTYQPVKLLSVALTNEPNIPGDAIANAEAPAPDLHATLAEMLDMKDDGDESALLDKLKERLEESERFYKMASHADDECQLLRNELREVQDKLERERSDHIETLLTQAVEDARIEPAQVDHWRERLLENFAEVAEELVTVNSRLPAQNLTHRLNLSNQCSRQRIQELVSACIDDSGDYARAWATARRRHPEAFASIR